MNTDGTETVKLKSRIVNRVRVHKKRTGTEMSKFIEIAILEKLEREKLKSDAITNSNQRKAQFIYSQ